MHLVAAGSTFNEVPALDGGPNPASVAALEPTRVYVIRSADLFTMLHTRPSVAEAVIRTMAGRLRQMVSLVEDLSLYQVSTRIAKILLEREHIAEQSIREHHLTQQELAALAGTVREVVGRVLKGLEASGIIEVHYGSIVVLDSVRLALLANHLPNSPDA